MKKGFTLVELIATLVILSIIALIVTPNILVSIREYKLQVYDTNIKAIEGASKNWATDNIELLPETDAESLLISIEELVDGSYIDEKVKDPINKGSFDDEDHFTFVIIDCYKIEDEITGELINTKYEYNVYISIDDFIEKKAIEYVKDKNYTTTTTLEYSTLINEKYINNNIKYKNGTELVIDEINNIIVSYDDQEYSAVVNWK